MCLNKNWLDLLDLKPLLCGERGTDLRWPPKPYWFAKAANSFDKIREGGIVCHNGLGYSMFAKHLLQILGSSVCGGAVYFYVLSSLPSGDTWWTETHRNQFLTSPKVLHAAKCFALLAPRERPANFTARCCL